MPSNIFIKACSITGIVSVSYCKRSVLHEDVNTIEYGQVYNKTLCDVCLSTYGFVGVKNI